MEGQYRRKPFIANLLIVVIVVSLLLDSSAFQMQAETVFGAGTDTVSPSDTVTPPDAGDGDGTGAGDTGETGTENGNETGNETGEPIGMETVSANTLSGEAEGVTVTAKYEPGVLPEGAGIRVVADGENAEKYADALNARPGAQKNAQYYDISFVSPGDAASEVSVNGNVKITLALENPIEPVDSDTGSQWFIVHMQDDGNSGYEAEDLSVYETTEFGVNADGKLVSVTFESNSFSPYVVGAKARATSAAYDAETLVNALELGGYVVLNGDIDFGTAGLTDSIEISEDTILDLYGHTITVGDVVATSVFEVNEGVNFTLTDTSAQTVEVVCDDIVHEDTQIDVDAESGAVSVSETKSVSVTSGAGKITGSTQRLFDVKGTLKIENGVLEGNAVSPGAPLINVEIVESGKLGFIMTGGIIRNNSVSGSTSVGVIQVLGGDVELSGGAISYNEGKALFAVTSNVKISGDALVSHNKDIGDGGAIHIEHGTLTMTGGYICGNTWSDTAADSVGGGIFASATQVKISGGSICCNETQMSGGGLYLAGDAASDITAEISDNAVIANNTAQMQGGGIHATGLKLSMTGGTVAGNVAEDMEGGGISITNNDKIGKQGAFSLTGGKILNNVTLTDDDWGGGGIFCSLYTSFYVKNALITDNTAHGFGGGVTGCSTGRLYLFANRGGAIFDNEAYGEEEAMSGAGSTKHQDRYYAFDSEVFMADGNYQDYYGAYISTVYNDMMGGGKANWRGSADGVPVSSAQQDPLTATYTMGLTAYPDENDKANARDAAQVIVSGNVSFAHGGGILCNGYMLLGDERPDDNSPSQIVVTKPVELKAEKILQDVSGKEIGNMPAGTFQFELVDEQQNVVTKGTNDANGEILFDRVLTFGDPKGVGGTGVYTYTLYEVNTGKDGVTYDEKRYTIEFTVERRDNSVIRIGGNAGTDAKVISYYISNCTITRYDSSGNPSDTILTGALKNSDGADAADYIMDAFDNLDWWGGLDIKYTFTNTRVIELTVDKVWDDENDKNNTRPQEIVFELFGNEKTTDKTLTLTEADGWKSGVFVDVPKYDDNGETINYTIKEYGAADSYTNAVETIKNGEDVTGYKVTNFLKPSEPSITPGPDGGSDDGSDDGDEPEESSTADNQPPADLTAVKTGDNAAIKISVGLLLLAVALIVGAGFIGRKKKY